VTHEQGASRSARGVYGISVASELSGIGPQTLRLYERWGLINPSRTAGGTRRYSDDDIAQLRRISELVNQGVNLAGIAHILDLQSQNTRLESDNTRLEVRNAQLEANHPPQARPDSASHQRPTRRSGHSRGRSNTQSGRRQDR
jgi:MerR family transcriptional regulator/heat shock protein HspR